LDPTISEKEKEDMFWSILSTGTNEFELFAWFNHLGMEKLLRKHDKLLAEHLEDG